MYFLYFYGKYKSPVKTFFHLLLSCLVCFILHSCANIAPPPGGKKDEKKPKLTKTVPINGSTQFRGKVVAFTFNEWVEENKVKENLIITPKVDEEMYKRSVNRNVFTITLDSGALKPNTTYYFNLRQGMKDITEGNTSDSVSLVFSTGSSLDSLSLKGQTLFTLDNKKEKNVSVALYPLSDTFRLETAKPYYLTPTDDDGQFSFSYLKEGVYLLYAFKDENSNGKYDKNKEYISFQSKPIEINSSGFSEDLLLVKEDHEKPHVRSVETNKKKITKIQYKKPIKSLNIKNLNMYNMNILYTFKKDEVSIFSNRVMKDTVQLILEALDMSGNLGIDTVKTVSLYVDTSRVTLAALPASGSEIEPTDSIQILLTQPFQKFDNQIQIRTQGTIFKGKEIEKIATIKEVPNQALITIFPKHPWTDTISITCFPKSFSPISGYIKDTLKAKYTLKTMDRYGSIGGTVETSSKNIIVQLVTKDGKVIKEKTTPHFLFEYLLDGEYKIRVIEDLNQNGTWDQSDYRTKQLPEPIHHYPDAIKLKSNWEILDVKIAF